MSIAAVPTAGASGVVHVYWIYGERMEPLYVGIAADVDQRMRQHSEKAWWASVRRIDSRPYPSREAAATAERGEIKRLSPRWNRAHNTPAASPKPQPIPRVNARGRRKLVSINEAAEYAGVSPKTIRRWVSAGRIAAYRAGPRLIRLDLNEVDAMMSPIPTVGSDQEW